MANSLVRVIPPGMEALACQYEHPPEFLPVEIPSEEVDFSVPHRFLAIAICASRYAFGVFTIGVRPSYEDGTLEQWISYVCGQEGIAITGVRQAQVSGYEAFRVTGRQETGEEQAWITTLFVRAGDRFYAVSGTTLAPLEASMTPPLEAMLDSFALLGNA
jgi:hypothetical protein